MAEYYMTYNEISDELDKFLAESEDISSIFIAIWELLNSVKKLDNWDFCVYMH